MNNIRRSTACLLATTAMFGLAAAAQAQTPAAPARAGAAAPAARTVSGDWNTGCSGEGATRVCDAVQSLVDNTTHAERIRVSIARQKSTGAYGVQVKTPLGLRLDSGAMLRFSEANGDAVADIKFNRCLPDGCYADRPLTAAEYAKLKAAAKMDLVVLDLGNNPVIVAISVNGMKAALDRL